MEFSAFNSNFLENIGKETKKSKNLQIRLIGHCIICLKKVSGKRKRTNEYPGEASPQPEGAAKSVVSSPGFLLTFNQVWTVLQTKWKERDGTKMDDWFSNEAGISLENVLQNGCVSTNVSFSRAPTICEVCCDKVLAVENLMKAVRQQVREISMLLEEGRRRQDGGFGEFEKNLREECLEERVIRATLQFVGIFDRGGCQDDCQGDHTDVGSAATSTQDDRTAAMIKMMEADDEMENNQVDEDEDNEGQTETISGDETGDDGDPDYVKEEADDDVSTDGNEESEEEMEVDDDDKNDPNFQIEKDPLALFPQKPKSSPPKRWRPQDVSSNQEDEETKKFLCTCGKRYATKKGRSEHLRLNKGNHPEFRSHGNQQTCEICGKWVVYNDIEKHLIDVHLNGQAVWLKRCPNEKCRYKCVTSKSFQSHVRTTDKRTLGCNKIWKEKCGPVCEICGFKGTNMLKINNHVRDKHEKGEEKKWKCPISNCGKMFFIKQSVDYHLSEHRYRPQISQQVCDKCGENLKVKEMDGHLKDKHGVNEVIRCKHCELRFSGREEMVEHLFEHRGIGIFCDICDAAKFGKYGDLREHYFGVHNLCPKKYKCGEEDCEIWFWRKGDKEKHEKNIHKNVTVSGNRVGGVSRVGTKMLRKKCDLCDYEYTKENSLIKHNIRVHGADLLKCDICGETFDDRRAFLQHKKEHAGIPIQKEWKCEEEGCGRTFKKKISWKHHVEIGHTGERPHVCEICGKGYTLAKTLKSHRDAVHLKLKPWVCDQCGERFAESGTLTTHKLIHSGERKFECVICGQRFRHKGVLKTHLKGHEKKGEEFKPNGPMKQLRKRKAVQ